MGAGWGHFSVIPIGIFTPGPQLLYDAIASAGLTSNLKPCLDIADGASWPGSGQKWLDRSGGGYDFFRGASASSESSDPTATSTPDADYWAFSGDDRFTYDTTNETFMEDWHKDNAVISGICAVSTGSVSVTQGLLATITLVSSGHGIAWYLTSGKPRFLCQSSSTAALGKTADASLTANTWYILGFTINEPGGAGASFLIRNGAYDQVSAANTFDGAYTGPASGSTTGFLSIGSGQGGAACLASGSKLGFMAVWSGTALSQAQHLTLYDLLKLRYELA